MLSLILRERILMPNLNAFQMPTTISAPTKKPMVIISSLIGRNIVINASSQYFVFKNNNSFISLPRIVFLDIASTTFRIAFFYLIRWGQEIF
jgi:hypothetical protein